MKIAYIFLTNNNIKPTQLLDNTLFEIDNIDFHIVDTNILFNKYD